MKRVANCLVAAFMLLSTSIIRAQNSRSLLIGQVLVPLESVAVTDSSAAGRMVYLASFELGLRDNENLTALKYLSAGITEGKSLSLSIQSADLTGKILEERFYQSAVIQEILLPPADAADRSAAKVQVKIRSASLTIKEGGGNVTTNTFGKRVNIATSSNFRLMLGGLPASRVTKISGIRIVAGQPASFTIDLADADAKVWRDWLMSAPSKRESGTLEWLAPNFKDVLCRIELRDAEITAVSSQYSIATESRVQGRVTIGIRAKVSSLF